MPFIQIKSLPLKETFDISKAILDINSDFSITNHIPINHVHTTWEFYISGQYAKGENAPNFQPESHHPLIVDLLTPDFNKSDAIKTMLTSLAKSISDHSKIDLNNIFINHRHAHSGMVFDDGKIVEW